MAAAELVLVAACPSSDSEREALGPPLPEDHGRALPWQLALPVSVPASDLF